MKPMTTWFVQVFAVLLMGSFVLIPAANGQAADSGKSVYRVAIRLNDPPSATVQADVVIKDGRLLMIGGSVDHLPRGWGTFVHDLKVSEPNGKQLSLEEFSDERYKTQWRVSGNYSGRARLNYRVDLSFSKTKWGAGNEQAAFYDGKALFAATRVLFIVPDVGTPAEIRLEVPGGVKIAAPWRSSGLPNGFEASGNELVNNTLVAGEFGGFTARSGNFRFTIALLGEAKAAEAAVSEALAKYARMFNSIFDKTPDSSYMMTLFYADSEDGESYSNSAAFTTLPPINADNLIMWGNTLGHELFHFWCGQQISGENYNESQWFQEGFTEYYANLALMRENILPERFFIWKAENTLGKYIYFRTAPQFANVSIKNAGERKTTYRFGVYDSGWAVAFVLDITIREKSAGKRSLDDFMRLMYQKYGLTKTKYKYADVVVTASEIAGVDMSDFFKRYVEGTEVMPIAETLRKVGYGSASQEYANELYIYRDKATPLKTTWLRTR